MKQRVAELCDREDINEIEEKLLICNMRVMAVSQTQKWVN
jgi:hypothetical protein